MPTKDFYYTTVKTALIKDQWSITHDPLSLKLGKKDFYVDLGASHLLAAEKEARKIAFEIKSFTGRSDINDLEKALGQYVEIGRPLRVFPLAVPDVQISKHPAPGVSSYSLARLLLIISIEFQVSFI